MKKKKILSKKSYIIILMVILGLEFGFTNSISNFYILERGNQNLTKDKEQQKNIGNLNQNVNLPYKSGSNSSNDDGVLYSAVQNGVNINETALITKNENEVIGNGSDPNYTEKNTSISVDQTHNWQGYSYNASITNILDERDWVTNGNFGNNENLTSNTTITQIQGSPHKYSNGLDNDPTNPSNVMATIDGKNSDYIRIHFTQIETEENCDFVCLYDQNYVSLKNYTGSYSDIYSPWFKASEINITMYSDLSITYYGFSIDFYELFNGSVMENWNYYSISSDNLDRSYASMDNESDSGAVYAAIEGYDDGSGYINYNNDDESGFFQMLNIPRGEVTNAWISIDYFMEYGMDTNNLNTFVKINDNIIYSKGFQTITEMGKNEWYTTGLIPLYLWENSSNVFLGDLDDNPLKISFGIRSISSLGYSGFDDENLQKVYFDNVQVILQTRANSTQNDINLSIDGNPVINTGNSQSANNGWGFGGYETQNSWDENPINFTLMTDSPELEFNLLSNLYVTHYITSNSTQNGKEGVLLTVLTNGSIRWEFYHNVYVPPSYQNFEFNITKPINWIISDVKDPTGISIAFSGGNYSEDFMSVNQSYAYFPGWWNFKAESSNFLLKNSTYLWKGGSWQNISSIGEERLIYDVNDAISIKTALILLKWKIIN